MSHPNFTVLMHRKLVDQLDYGFSPLDGIIAIDEMLGELPLLHQAIAPKRPRKRAGRTLKVYRGCYHWYDSLGISYVQIGTTLHVIDLWFDENPNLAAMDVILGTGKTEGFQPLQSEQSGDGEQAAGGDRDFVPLTKPLPIIIEVRGGIVQDVQNVPPGFDYEIRDYDDRDESPAA
jgi:hypothetical protein